MVTAVNGNSFSGSTNGNGLKIDFGYKLGGLITVSGTVVVEQQGSTDGKFTVAGTDTVVPGATVFLFDNANNFLGATITDPRRASRTLPPA
jgi:hypothetical protein